MPAEQWFDDMILAAVCGLPMKLESAGTALGLAEDKAKMKEGKQLIRWFASPYYTKKDKPPVVHTPEEYPDKWEKYREYNSQDVVAEREIHNLLIHWEPSETEHRAWVVDQHINDRGVRIDTELARNAMEMDALYKAELTEEAIALTGMDNPNSVAQIKDWLLEQEGIEVTSLNKKVVADVVAQLSTDKAKRFMELRTELSKSSTKKYAAMVNSACADDHAKGCFQFYGAGRTGRWAGRRVQFQNMSKNKSPDIDQMRRLVKAGDYEGVSLIYGKVSSVLSELVRTALIPEEGHRFIVCDYSAIEARVLSWIAGEEWALDEFRGDGMIYEATGARMFGVPKKSIGKGGENHHLRQPAKTAELACGYGGGMGAMKAFGADKMGMSDEAIINAVDLWREAHPNVCKLWKSLERAAIRCVVHGTPQVSSTGNIRFTFEKGVLWMHLPSGRRISYFSARYGDGAGKFTQGKKVLSYMGLDQKTHKWTRIETFSGKITENLVQATARDCLRDALDALDREGFRIVAHIHDEVVISEPRNGRTLEDVAEIMGRELSWAPGLPLRGDGYYCDYYIKD
ncbi:MAG: DNA polymerase [Akkermansia sp.]|nr:DNA polymerase [Akkermansia sp.]